MDPERASYLKAVESRFLKLRGRGLMLSPRDVMLVERWRDRGLPLRVVLGAIEEGVERFVDTHPEGTPLPSSLAYFAGHIDEAAVERRELLLDQPDPEVAEQGRRDATEAARRAILEAIAEAGRRQETESAREALRIAWRRLVKPSGEDLWSLVTRTDAEVLDLLAATLSGPDREALEASIAQALERAGAGRMGVQARGDIERAEFERQVRRRFGVPDMVEVLLSEEGP